MDNLDKVRARQKSKSEKKSRKVSRARSTGAEMQLKRTTMGAASSQGASSRAPSNSRKRRKRSKYAWVFTTLKIMFLVFLIGVIAAGSVAFSMIDFTFGDDLSSMNLNISSKVYYTDANGDAVQYAQFDGTEKRIWVPINKMPSNLTNAFVAIEDQRFFKHSGVDLKRTAGATLNYLIKGDSSYGGSTITQQLVKNITSDKERTKTRKIREILRALVLETKLSKEQILEMYLNTIYLSQGTNGVEAAANVYFSKEVSELTLAECACIAGITQYPARYDPITQPEANKEKRTLVLDKMLELEYISQKEYDEAINEEIKINPGKTGNDRIQSYFLDHLFEEIQQDLIEKGYTAEFAANMIYNGGLKIYSTVDPTVQRTMEDYFEDNDNFPRLSGSTQPQAAMVISDPHTGEIKGIIGGRGEKDRNRGLNRATQSKRQPGSSIKPIAVYAPAVDLGLITQSTSVDDSPLDINGWRPKNSGGNFRGFVSVGTAVTYSYNIPAVRVLEEVGVDRSFNYMSTKLHMDSLVNSRTNNGKTYTDKNLSSLALGGLTDGVTVLEMNTAYSALANGGEYIEPHAYTKVYDVEGKLILDNEIERKRAFSESTAFIMSNMLENVVTSGTGAGAKMSNIDTCGKTGTTDDSKDRWFIGYTPYYCGSVWFGYDEPRAISASGNPALNIWDNIMTKLHKDLPARSFAKPSSVEELSVCQRTGCAPGPECPVVTQYADASRAKTVCTSSHEYIGTEPYMSIEDEEDEGEETDEEVIEDEDTEGGDTAHEQSTDTSGEASQNKPSQQQTALPKEDEQNQ